MREIKRTRVRLERALLIRAVRTYARTHARTHAAKPTYTDACSPTRAPTTRSETVLPIVLIRNLNHVCHVFHLSLAFQETRAQLFAETAVFLAAIALDTA